MARPIGDLPSQRSLTRTLSFLLLGSLVGAVGLGAACGGGSLGTGSGGSGGAGTGGTKATTSSGLGGDLAVGSVGSGPSSNLSVTPNAPSLMIDLPLPAMPPTVTFKCIDNTTMMPVASPTWSLDKGSLGLIDKQGVFTPSGNGAGQVKVTCAANGQTASTTLTLLMHAVDNMGVSPTDVKTLQAMGGQPDAGWQWLYPYDQTVFPRATLPPQIHLTPGNSSGTIPFYVHIKSPVYEYEGFFAADASNTQLEMSQAAWDALTLSAGGSTVQVDVAKLFNGQKYGPTSRSWVLAPGRLHGVIYYNTYNSQAAGTGAMLRIKGTSKVPEVLVGNCTVCHSVAKDGSTAAAANHSGPGGIFDLTSGMTNPPLIAQDPELYSFAGLYPQGGQFIVTNAAPGSSWPPNTPGTSQGPYTSQLRTRMGMQIPNSGIESYYAQSPMFSPDGKMLAFYDRQSGQFGDTPGKLALMDFDSKAQKFSNYRVLANPPSGTEHYSWPDFTPDSKFVFFQDGTGGDLATWSSNTGKIQIANVTNGTITYPKLLNGDGIVNQPGRDENKNYEPTIMPIASGGYFWIMFTSRRTYGNVLTADQSQTKRLWVSALDINITDGTDPSHPPFYIRGQELTSGNSRGFWTLDACKPMGGDCMTADDCCDGYCYQQNDGSMKCSPPEQMCAPEFGNCKTAADCCDSGDECIGGKCSYVPPK